MKKLSVAILATVAFALISAGAGYAQEQHNGAGPANAEIVARAKEVFTALAAHDVSALKKLTVSKRKTRKMSETTVVIPPTGPKLLAAFDGNVKVLRRTPQFAVVEADFFKLDEKDIPQSEINHVRVFLIEDNGEWLLGIPKKKQAANDTGPGGWYHAGSFTFCPNKGFVYLSNHFSTEVDCTTTAICK